MARSYVKMEVIAGEMFQRKANGDINREIREHFGLSKYQIKQKLSVHTVKIMNTSMPLTNFILSMTSKRN